jgi:two-component system, OmpR family, sensor histidine kinase VicK
MDRLGLVDYLIDKAQNKNYVIQIKIICPITDVNSDIINRILQQAPKNNNIIRIVNGNDTSSAIIVVDNAKFLKAELREPEAEEFSGAIGLSFYSNSKASVDSYRLFFELLWKERTTNEKLKLHDKMQEEFINIAAHELRTPTQSILGYSELLLKDRHDKTTKKDYEIIQAIHRNANRLQKLTQDILDISRIESQTFKLNNEIFNLVDNISDAIKDVKRQIIDNKINISYKAPNNDVYINADKERISQVISNLLNNAIKFTSKEGTISIITTEVSGSKVDEGDKNKNNKEVIISVKDTGSGIDPAIMLRLFEKFATKSDKGTGLGLFISKTIIEAHGGKI